jgi:hypothetical protein
MVGELEAGILGPVLVSGMTGQNGRDVEYYRGFFICEGEL